VYCYLLTLHTILSDGVATVRPDPGQGILGVIAWSPIDSDRLFAREACDGTRRESSRRECRHARAIGPSRRGCRVEGCRFRFAWLSLVAAFPEGTILYPIVKHSAAHRDPIWVSGVWV